MGIGGPWQMRSSTLAILVTSVGAGVVLIASLVRADQDGLRLIAAWVSFIGAAITFAGLLYAYVRSNVELRRWFGNLMHRLRIGPRTLTVEMSPISLRTAFGSLNLSVQHTFLTADKVDDPVERLLARTDALMFHVNNIEQSLSDAHGKIHSAEKSIERARADARKGDEQTRAEASSALQQFAESTRRTEYLDLRWAIAGTFIQTGGALLGLLS
ncbi:hypothetical protein [Mycolicibacterium sp. A43C]